MEGWIKLHRKLLENAIFYKADYFQIWSYILLKVNHEDKKIIWNNESKVIKKGSGIFSQQKISKELKIPVGTVSNALKYLKSERQIEIKPTNKFTEIEVINWEEYQGSERKVERKMNTKCAQDETNKNDKNDKNINIVEECQTFVSIYGQEMLNDFLRYWTEKANNGKEKWQLQKTWETERRLVTWKKKSEEFKKPYKQTPTQKPAFIV